MISGGTNSDHFYINGRQCLVLLVKTRSLLTKGQSVFGITSDYWSKPDHFYMKGRQCLILPVNIVKRNLDQIM